MIAEIESHFSDEELTKLAQGIGIRIYPISEYYIDKNKVPEYPAILFRIWGLTEKEIEQGFRELDKIMLFFLAKECEGGYEKRIRIAICDDDSIGRGLLQESLEYLLQENNLQAEISSYCSGQELLREQNRYDILFLDIRMPKINGIGRQRNIGSGMKIRSLFF